MCRKYCLLILIIFAIGCNKSSKPAHTAVVVNVEDSSVIPKNKVYVKYKIPLPLDLFNYFLGDSEFSNDYLLPLDVGDKCISDKHKSLVIGLSNADIAFCAVTSHAQLASQYFDMSKQLAADLGIDVGYTEQLYRRFNQNINNTDSIQKLADEAYWRTCNYLEDNNKYNILPFVVASGWFESVYLLIMSKKAENYSDNIKDIILKQESGFKSVRKFLYDSQLQTNANYYYQDIKKIIDSIEKILNLYQLYYSDVSKKETYYNQLINIIFDEREKFINGQF